jgi:hypothetical protein
VPLRHQAILPFFFGTVLDGGGGFHDGSLSSKMLAPWNPSREGEVERLVMRGRGQGQNWNAWWEGEADARGWRADAQEADPWGEGAATGASCLLPGGSCPRPANGDTCAN